MRLLDRVGQCHRILSTLCLVALTLLRPVGMPGQAANSASTTSSGPTEKVVPHAAQTFKFTKVDLELLREVEGFDKYVEEQGWVYREPETDKYVQQLGLSLVPAETPENVNWRFRVIRDVEVNAFALPNGSIYVNSGLLSRMENEAQLAGVLAHEITHVVNRHSYLENRSSRKKMVAVDVILAAASAASYAGVSPAITLAMGALCRVRQGSVGRPGGRGTLPGERGPVARSVSKGARHGAAECHGASRPGLSVRARE